MRKLGYLVMAGIFIYALSYATALIFKTTYLETMPWVVCGITVSLLADSWQKNN